MLNSIMSNSIMGHDFVRYRMNNDESDRTRFSNNIRSKGIGEVPVVIDSLDLDISHALGMIDTKIFTRNKNGKEYKFHMDLLIEDVLLEVNHKLKKQSGTKYKIGLENGKMLDNSEQLGILYKKYKNQNDGILYLLLTEETTIYGYLISILKFIFGDKIAPR